jgi:hypothetical protein
MLCLVVKATQETNYQVMMAAVDWLIYFCVPEADEIFDHLLDRLAFSLDLIHDAPSRMVIRDKVQAPYWKSAFKFLEDFQKHLHHCWSCERTLRACTCVS